MPEVTFVSPAGGSTRIDATSGTTVMMAAVSNGVTGITADCGGAASCATCHVYVDPAWLDHIPALTGDEEAMLDCTAAERCSNSRLSCQIFLSDALDGIVVTLPDRQS